MLAKRSDSLALYDVTNILNFFLEHFFQSIAIIVNKLLNVLHSFIYLFYFFIILFYFFIFISHKHDNSRNGILSKPSMKNLSLCNDFTNEFIYFIFAYKNLFITTICLQFYSCSQLPNN